MSEIAGKYFKEARTGLRAAFQGAKRVFLRCAISFIRFFCGRDTDSWRYDVIEAPLRLLSIAYFHPIIVPRWSRFLAILGARFRRVRWLSWAAKRFNSPEYIFAHADASQALFGTSDEEFSKYYGRWKNSIRAFSTNKNLLRKRILGRFDQAAEEEADFTMFADDAEFAAKDSYEKLWLAHIAGDGAGVIKYIYRYARAIDWDYDAVKYVTENILLQGGYHKVTLDLMTELSERLDIKIKRVKVDAKLSKRERSKAINDLAFKLSSTRNFVRYAHHEMGTPLNENWTDLPDPLYLDKRSIEEYYWAALDAKQLGDDVSFESRIKTYISNAPKWEGKNLAIAHSHLAVFYEENRRFDLARMHYEKCYLLDGVPYYLPNGIWRYVTCLMAVGDWVEAAGVLLEGHRRLWPIYSPLGKIKYEKILNKPDGLIRKKGAFILGCQGVGDDLIRLALLVRYVKNLNSRFGMSCDPRMLGILRRSLPRMKFIATKRLSGPRAVSLLEFLQDRESVPSTMDLTRVNKEVLLESAKFKDVMPSEDIFLHYVRKGGKFPSELNAPILKVHDDDLSSAVAWLESLGRNLKVGISWRSGVRDKTRNEYYVDALDLGAYWNLEGVDYVSLQYSDTSEEEYELMEIYGRKLHKMPGVDLKDDLDKVAALCLACDIVVSISTTVRELAGMVGANVLCMSTTPVYPDLWRIESDGETDTIFPTLTHVTVLNEGSKDAVITEVANRLAIMAGSIEIDAGKM